MEEKFENDVWKDGGEGGKVRAVRDAFHGGLFHEQILEGRSEFAPALVSCLAVCFFDQASSVMESNGALERQSEIQQIGIALEVMCSGLACSTSARVR
jgi:hypothetical protein